MEMIFVHSIELLRNGGRQLADELLISTRQYSHDWILSVVDEIDHRCRVGHDDNGGHVHFSEEIHLIAKLNEQVKRGCLMISYR
jgi:hypothetical protein